MKNSNIKNLQTQEIVSEIMDKIVEGKNPDIETFLLDGMSNLLNQAFLKERELFLENVSGDKANGFLPNRKVNLGTNAIEIAVPRTRNLGFYPSMLPKYSRNIGSEYQNILEGIILNSKSFRSIADAVRSLGLSYSPKQIESLVNELFEEAKKYNSRQLECDYAFVYIDAKVIDINDESNQIKKAVHFTAIGINLEMRKELLLSEIFYGSESLEIWKKVIVNLKNRGLTRVLMMITDDFSGLNKMLSSLLPKCDHQLCLVHLMRNLKKNLDKNLYEEFRDFLQEIYLCSSFEAAYSRLIKFIDEKISKENKSYANYLKERAENYLFFTKYPAYTKPAIRSTNAVEGINNAIEIARRNSGGYFHSERELMVKLKITFDNMARTKWSNPIPRFAASLSQIHQMFFERFGQ